MREFESKLIVNVTRGNVVCERAIVTADLLAGLRGLLGGRALAKSEGLLRKRVPSVHTFFRHEAIDAVFLDSDFRVVKLVPHLRPWRAVRAARASAVLELADGETEHRGIALANRLAVVDHTRAHRSAATCALLVSGDRRYRSVVSMLLTRRGYRVLLGNAGDDLAELVTREGAKVVVLDGTPSLTEAVREAEKLQALCPSVGAVVVAETLERTIEETPVVLKWGAFGSLFEAIEKARSGERAGATR